MIRGAPALRRRLLAWYDAARRDLPWRRDQHPFGVWISEIMLQQTRVQTVIPYYERFLAAFPSVQRLAAAPLARVLQHWQGLGYYSRARNLHAAAIEITVRRAGCLPATASDWQSLPGVGRYTAAAIASICSGEPVAALDGNIKRVLARLLRIDTPIDAPHTVAVLWAAAGELLDRRRAGDFNQALMELGATLCTPRAPRCTECPLRGTCAARAAGVVHELPRRRGRAVQRTVHGALLALEHRGRWLLRRRPPRGLLGGLWGLPLAEQGDCGDAREAARGDDFAERALCAWVRMHLKLRIRRVRALGAFSHVLTHRRFELRVVRAEVCGRPRAGGEDERWLRPADFGSVPCARLDRKALALLGAGAARERGAAGNLV